MLKNQKGMAALEVVSIFAVIMILFNFSLGFYGVIQTGILKGMAARNYAMETYRFRSNLDFFWRKDGSLMSKFRLFGNRYHGTTSEFASDAIGDDWIATARPISFISTFGGTSEAGEDFSRTPATDSNQELHNRTIFNIRDDGKALLDDKDKYKAYPVWIKTIYGICLNADCAPTQSN